MNVVIIMISLYKKKIIKKQTNNKNIIYITQ